MKKMIFRELNNFHSMRRQIWYNVAVIFAFLFPGCELIFNMRLTRF